VGDININMNFNLGKDQTVDDIVTRLRQEWEYGNNAQGCDYEMFAQAADEIERLRSEVARINTFLHPIGVVINQEVRGE